MKINYSGCLRGNDMIVIPLFIEIEMIIWSNTINFYTRRFPMNIASRFPQPNKIKDSMTDTTEHHTILNDFED